MRAVLAGLTHDADYLVVVLTEPEYRVDKSNF